MYTFIDLSLDYTLAQFGKPIGNANAEKISPSKPVRFITHNNNILLLADFLLKDMERLFFHTLFLRLF